jgi:hypothetical protein
MRGSSCSSHSRFIDAWHDFHGQVRASSSKVSGSLEAASARPAHCAETRGLPKAQAVA